MGWQGELHEDEERSRFRRGERMAGFVLDRLVGLSVTGEVWQARHVRTGNVVALRIFSLLGVPGGMQTLQHEAELSRHLRHPNVVRLFGLKRSAETAILVTELVQGRSLAQLFEATRAHGLSLPPAATLDVCLGIARALDYAWDGLGPDGEPLRIVHRDLVPSKVLVGWDGSVKIGGFSVARAASDLRRTQTGVLRGEVTSMAPERLEGSKLLGPPTDLYSLGVLLWEMGAGRPFYDSSRLTSIFRTCRERSPDEEAAGLAAFIPDVGPLVLRLLQRDFDRRPQLASEVVRELEALAAATPCEGGLAQLLDRVEVLEAREPDGEVRGTCPWDAVVEIAGACRAGPRPGSTPRPHPRGRGVCGRPSPAEAVEEPVVGRVPGIGPRAAVGEAADRTDDWSALSDDESEATSDWSTLEIDDWNQS